jgi:hypothetical protein
MKVSPNNVHNKTLKNSSKEDIQSKIKEKFGKDFSDKKAVKTDGPAATVELSAKSKGVTNSTEEAFGDIQKNDPNSPETQEKLKGLLRSGGFDFSEKERQVLSQILK